MKFVLCLLLLILPKIPLADNLGSPIPIIFDTDLGNDVDDALALGIIHSLETRMELELLAVTITKDNDLAAPFADAINSFYGRRGVPIR